MASSSVVRLAASLEKQMVAVTVVMMTTAKVTEVSFCPKRRLCAVDEAAFVAKGMAAVSIMAIHKDVCPLFTDSFGVCTRKAPRGANHASIPRDKCTDRHAHH